MEWLIYYKEDDDDVDDIVNATKKFAHSFLNIKCALLSCYYIFIVLILFDEKVVSM